MSGPEAMDGGGPPLSPEGQAFVRSIGAATDLPAFVRNVQSIASVAADLRVRVAMLEDAIVKDVALTGKVLRIASSAMHGTGTSITSVKQAIMLLGYERVQQVSTAASVFDQIERSAPAVQDLLVLSVMTANQSLCLAVEAGFARPETAYLCGLFRNLGELLVACYRSKQYREWLAAAPAPSGWPAGAEEKEFHFTFDSIGMALARQWGMPAELVRTMHRVPPPEGAAGRDMLLHLTQFSADLTRLTYSTADERDAIDALTQSYMRPLGVDSEKIQDAMDMSRVEAKATLASMQVTLDEWSEDRGARAARVAADRLSADESGRLAELEASCAPVDTDSPGEAHVREAVRALTAKQRANGDAPDVAQTTGAALDAVRGAGYARVLLALATEDLKMIRGRMASGQDAEALERAFVVRPTPSFGPLGAALHRRQELFVVLDDEEGKPFRRERLVRELRPRCFAMLPLVVGDRLVGCLYFDHCDAVIEATETLQGLLRHTRDHLVRAFAERRAESERPADMSARTEVQSAA